MRVLQNIFQHFKLAETSPLVKSFIEEYEQKHESATIEDLEAFNQCTDYENILYLDLSGENLTEIPKEIALFVNLKALNLSNNDFSKADLSIISELKHLQALFLVDCKLLSIKINFEQIENLRFLSLANNEINKNSIPFSFLRNLVFLDISSNPTLFDAPPTLFEVTTEPVFGKLTNLSYLNISDTNISDIKDSFFVHLEKLSTLDLSQNTLNSLPDSIVSLKQLKALHLKRNIFSEFPEKITQITGLKHLCIGGRFESLPDNIGDLVELKDLDLQANKLQAVPYSFRNLLNLERLDFSDNEFDVFPIEITFLSNIEHLSLDGNKINELPNEIENLKHIKVLNLSNNKLIDFPLCLVKLHTLERLFLDRNQISTLPAEIAQLSKLERLNLIFNKLKNLPIEIGELKKLRELLLDFNELTEYPVEIANLKRLRRLYLLENNSNPLSNMPEQVKDWSLIELFEHLSEKRGEHNHYVFWDIPKELRRPFQQYLAYFQDYVEKKYGNEIVFEVSKVQGGLKLTTKSSLALKIQQIDSFLSEYVNIFLNQNLSHIDFVAPDENNIAILQFNEFIRELKAENYKLTMEIERFQDKLAFQKDIIYRQDKDIEEYKLIIRSFQSNEAKILELAQSSFSASNPNIVVNIVQENANILGDGLHSEGKNGNGFKPEKLLSDIIEKLTRMLERKKVEKIEDLHNNELTHYLRDKDYYVTDQTQSGISHKNLGELDIMIRKKNGSPLSIIEAFRLKSCGDDDTVISTHIDKLLHDYDTAGHKTNYIIVYAEAVKFQDLWEKYIRYMQNLNSKKGFRGTYPLMSFIDTGKSNITEIKVGLAIHKREDTPIQVYHIFVNMNV